MTKPGDLWVLGRHRVKCGDAKDPLAYGHLMAGALAAMVVTDPPYNGAAMPRRHLTQSLP